jgi:hypothetical protein
MMDTWGGLFLVFGVAFSGYIDWRVAAAMLIAYQMLSIEVYLAAYTLGTFRLSFAMFGPTEVRLLLAAGNIALWFHPGAHIPGTAYRLLDAGGCIATAGMLLMLIVSAVSNTAKLYRQEPLP